MEGLDPTLLASILGLSLLDLINPSMLVATIILLALPNPARRLAAYVAGAILTYFAIGVAMMLGLSSFWSVLDGRPGYILLTVIGAVLFGYAIFAPDSKPDDTAPAAMRASDAGLLGIAAIGVSVTLIEMSTALPYVAAIGLMADAGLGPVQWLPILVVYNLVVMSPPVIIALVWLNAGERSHAWLQRRVPGLRQAAVETLGWIFGIAGFYMLFAGGGLLAKDFGWIT